MSLRVSNPVVMELRRAMRGGGAAADAGGLLGAAAAAAAAPATAEPCSQAVTRVRRNLFGPVDHEETRRFVERELELMSRRDEELYEFDFKRERPRDGPARRFVWERVQPGSVPESYALRRLSFLRASADAAAPAADAPPQPQPARPADAAAVAGCSDAAATPAARKERRDARPPCTPAPARTRQAHIHDFMPSRKRPVSAGEGKAKANTPAPKQQRKSAATASRS